MSLTLKFDLPQVAKDKQKEEADWAKLQERLVKLSPH
jgi:hypothetical protein